MEGKQKTPTGGHILLVDDYRELVAATKIFLESHGYRVSTAYDGIEALQLVQQELPDLIILDVMMPRLDGWATLEALQGDERTVSIPVLMLTAMKAQEDVQHSFNTGCTWFYPKPIADLEDLALVISGILEGTARDEEA